MPNTPTGVTVLLAYGDALTVEVSESLVARTDEARFSVRMVDPTRIGAEGTYLSSDEARALAAALLAAAFQAEIAQAEVTQAEHLPWMSS